MTEEFTDIIKKLISDKGIEILDNAQQCKGLLLDYSKNEHKRDITLFAQMLNKEFHKRLKSSTNLELDKKVLAKQWHEEFGVDMTIANDMLSGLVILVFDKHIPQQDYGASIKSSVYARRGDANRMKGQYDAAISDFNEAIKLNPNYFWAYGHRGEAKREKGQYDAAINDFNEAIRLDPNWAWAYGCRSKLYKVLGKRNLAIQDFKKAISLDSNLNRVKEELNYNG